jgi:hypothetical protein
VSATVLAVAYSVIALLFCACLFGAIAPRSELAIALAVVAAFSWPVTLPALLVAFAWAWFSSPRSAK